MNTKIILVMLGVAALSACTSPPALEPIPGSITYNGQPRSKLTKSPVGSTFDHSFQDRYGRRVLETYRIEPDRSLSLIQRRYLNRDILL